MGTGFPRKYLNFQEVLDRWKWTENDLREAIAEGSLRPSIWTSEPLRVPTWRRDVATDWMLPEGLEEGFRQEKGVEVHAPIFLYLQWPERRGPFECVFRLASDQPDAEAPSHEDEAADHVEARDTKTCWYILPQAMTMEDVQSNAVFMVDEVMRCETRSKSGITLPKKLGDRERATLMNIIGALLVLLENPKPGRNSQAKIIDELRVNFPEVVGFGDRTLEGKFAEAKAAFKASQNSKSG